MNAHVSVDCGFVRVPKSYLDLPISPGAKVLLMHLCSAANDRGESWYAYADIAAMLGRSKASVSAYVQELVDLNLVESIKQKTANGYNYRRRLKLVQWGQFLDLWEGYTSRKKSLNDNKKDAAREAKRKEFSVTQTAGSTSSSDLETPKTSDLNIKRRVQQTERKDPTGPINKTYQNKTHSDKSSVVWSEDDENSWKKFRPSDRDPISVANGKPDPKLVEKLIKVQADLQKRTSLLSPEAAHKSAQSRLEAFARHHRLTSNKTALGQAVEALTAIAKTQTSLNAAMAKLEEIWKPYWRELPTPKQIKDSLKDAAASAGPSRDLLTHMTKINERIWVARMHSKPKTGLPYPSTIPVGASCSATTATRQHL